MPSRRRHGGSLDGTRISGLHKMSQGHLPGLIAGHAWTTDYGNPDKEADFHYILRYSPVHNVRQPTGGTRQYPAILITTGK